MLLKILKEKLEILKKIKKKMKKTSEESQGVWRQPTREIELRRFILETEKAMVISIPSLRVRLKLPKRVHDLEI